MSLKRIVTVVVVVVVALALVYCLLDWESTKQVGAYVQSGLDARLHPDEWQLGDVKVRKDENDFLEQVSYASIRGDDLLGLTFGINEQGEALDVGYLLSNSRGSSGIMPSKLKLDQSRLTPEAAEAATLAQSIASAMRQHQPWPWSLRDISGRVKDISQGRMRVETNPAEGLFAYPATVVYGAGDEVELLISGSFVKLYLWNDRTVAARQSSGPALELTPGSAVVYTDGMPETPVFIQEVEKNTNNAIAILRATPNPAPGALERLERTRQWLATGKLTERPALDTDALRTLTRPWYVKLESSGPGGGLMEDLLGDGKSLPAKVGGVGVGEEPPGVNSYFFALTRGEDKLDWRPEEGKSTLVLRTEGMPRFSVNIVEDEIYPIAKGSFSDPQMEQALNSVLTMAQDMLAVPLDDWPKAPWRDRLHASLSALAAGRYSARSSFNWLNLESRLVSEGDSAWAVFSQVASEYRSRGDYLDLAVLPDGFAIRDTYSGCLLEVMGGAAALTQTHESAGAGASLHLAEAAALAEWASGSADKLPPGLAASLTQAREFLALPSLPSATLVDSMEVPAWSLEKIHQRTPARKPSASG